MSDLEPSASVGAGRGSLVDAADVDLVLRARQLRRRLRLLARVFRMLFIVALIGCCGFFFTMPSVGPPFHCRAQQSEAKGNLKALYVASESYRAEFDRYSDDTERIGFAPRGATIRYRYVVTGATDTAFRGWAFRVDGASDDVWTITEQNDLTNVVNGCY